MRDWYDEVGGLTPAMQRWQALVLSIALVYWQHEQHLL
jgi:hypothetical protein